jgi:4,5-DOPA dioxygenase extradiol
MLFDYYGFPPETYEYKYSAPGPTHELVQQVASLLDKSGVPYKTDDKRGFGRWSQLGPAAGSAG